MAYFIAASSAHAGKRESRLVVVVPAAPPRLAFAAVVGHQLPLEVPLDMAVAEQDVRAAAVDRAGESAREADAPPGVDRPVDCVIHDSVNAAVGDRDHVRR